MKEECRTQIHLLNNCWVYVSYFQVEVQISHIELFGEGKAVYYGMLMFVILLAIVLCIQILLKFKTLIASWKVFGRLPQWSTVAFPMLYLAMYLGRFPTAV